MLLQSSHCLQQTQLQIAEIRNADASRKWITTVTKVEPRNPKLLTGTAPLYRYAVQPH